MSFRERPEYQEWRDRVFQLFGQKCILCGHSGNIQAHHVRPVNEYPELAFDPNNGVPLCGNCHAEIRGKESAYVDQFEQLQRTILGGASGGAVQNEPPSESDLRERAYAEPSNVEAVQRWFAVATNAQAVVDFYNQHHQSFQKTALLYFNLAAQLTQLDRWQDAIKVTEKGIQLAETEGTPQKVIFGLARVKSTALQVLGKTTEAADFLRELVTRFPQDALLHMELSVVSFKIVQHSLENTDVPGNSLGLRQDPAEHDRAVTAAKEACQHALKAVQLAADDFEIVKWASFISAYWLDYASAIKYGKQALALASSDEYKVDALLNMAFIYKRNQLYADARGYLREAMEIDDCNVLVIASMAECYLMEENYREALRMAKQGLMLDPHNRICQDICSAGSPPVRP